MTNRMGRVGIEPTTYGIGAISNQPANPRNSRGTRNVAAAFPRNNPPRFAKPDQKSATKSQSAIGRLKSRPSSPVALRR